jgi:acyl-homoserine-lactone acylase
MPDTLATMNFPRSARALFATATLLAIAAAPVPGEQTRWREEAERVVITRDTWGIAHVRGQSDADAVFGATYAQAEDDFSRIEANYLTALGRTAEAKGRSGPICASGSMSIRSICRRNTAPAPIGCNG